VFLDFNQVAVFLSLEEIVALVLCGADNFESKASNLEWVNTNDLDAFCSRF
jgi:hypothetical protein